MEGMIVWYCVCQDLAGYVCHPCPGPALQSEVSEVCGDREYEEALEQCQQSIDSTNKWAHSVSFPCLHSPLPFLRGHSISIFLFHFLHCCMFLGLIPMPQFPFHILHGYSHVFSYLCFYVFVLMSSLHTSIPMSSFPCSHVVFSLFPFLWSVFPYPSPVTLQQSRGHRHTSDDLWRRCIPAGSVPCVPAGSKAKVAYRASSNL